MKLGSRRRKTEKINGKKTSAAAYMRLNQTAMSKTIYLFFLFTLFLSGQVGYGQCKDIRKQVDKFEGTAKIQSPLFKGSVLEPAVIIRRQLEGEDRYELRLTVQASASANKLGAYLLLSDGSKMDWPAEDVRIRYSNGFQATSHFALTPERLDILSKVEITAIRLYIYDKDLTKKEGERFKEYINCVVNANFADVKEGVK